MINTYFPELFLLARVLFGLLFLYNGIDTFASLQGRIAHAEGKGLPAANILIPPSGVLLTFGALGVISGAFRYLAIISLLLFLVPATIVGHDFWNLEGGERVGQTHHFFKNVAIIGAAILILLYSGNKWHYAINIHIFQFL